MQKPEWRFIENFVDPELFQQAYEFVESNEDKLSLQPGEAGSLLLKTNDPDVSDLYTEIGFGRKYLRHAYCRCGKAGKKLCMHLLAAIILHRRTIIEKDKAIMIAETNVASRISLPAILHQIPKEDLDRFIQRYARTNKQFGQALKLHFASRIQVASPDQKYHDLIKSMTRLVPNAMGKIAKSSLQSLFWISEELLLQADDLIVLENQVEAFAICHELLIKFHSIYRKLEVYFGDFEKYWILIHHKIKNIMDGTIAPDFRIEAEAKLIVQFNEPSYPFIHSPNNLFEILYSKSDQEQRKALKECLLKKIGRKDHNPIPLVAVTRQSMRFEDEQLLIAAFELNNDTSRWMAAVDVLHGTQREMAHTLCQWLMRRTRDEFWKNKIMDRLWSLFPDDPNVTHYALHLLATQPEEKYLRFLREKDVSMEIIIDALRESKHPRSKNLLVDFYINNHWYEEATEMLNEGLTLEILKSYTQKLWPHQSAWLDESYKRIFNSYLEQHMGPAPAIKIQNTLAYLHMVKAHTLAENLQKWIKKTFQDHTSLTERLG
ncbi:MAG: hypothetical protein ABIR66_13725 [Saprospiraceae bacterium]